MPICPVPNLQFKKKLSQIYSTLPWLNFKTMHKCNAVNQEEWHWQTNKAPTWILLLLKRHLKMFCCQRHKRKLKKMNRNSLKRLKNDFKSLMNVSLLFLKCLQSVSPVLTFLFQHRKRFQHNRFRTQNPCAFYCK